MDHLTLVAVDCSTWRSIGDGPQARMVDLVVDDPDVASVEVAGRRVPLVDARSGLPEGDPNRTADLVIAVLQLPPATEVVLLVDDPTAAHEALAVVATLRAEAARPAPTDDSS